VNGILGVVGSFIRQRKEAQPGGLPGVRRLQAISCAHRLLAAVGVV